MSQNTGFMSSGSSTSNIQLAPGFNKLLEDYLDIPNKFKRYTNLIKKEAYNLYVSPQFFLLPGCSVRDGEVMITEFATEGFLNAYSIQQYKLNILKNRFRDFVISSYLKSAMLSEMFKNSKINTLSPEELKNLESDFNNISDMLSGKQPLPNNNSIQTGGFPGLKSIGLITILTITNIMSGVMGATNVNTIQKIDVEAIRNTVNVAPNLESSENYGDNYDIGNNGIPNQDLTSTDNAEKTITQNDFENKFPGFKNFTKEQEAAELIKLEQWKKEDAARKNGNTESTDNNQVSVPSDETKVPNVTQDDRKGVDIQRGEDIGKKLELAFTTPVNTIQPFKAADEWRKHISNSYNSTDEILKFDMTDYIHTQSIELYINEKMKKDSDEKYKDLDGVDNVELRNLFEVLLKYPSIQTMDEVFDRETTIINKDGSSQTHKWTKKDFPNLYPKLQVSILSSEGANLFREIKAQLIEVKNKVENEYNEKFTHINNICSGVENYIEKIAGLNPDGNSIIQSILNTVWNLKPDLVNGNDKEALNEFLGKVPEMFEEEFKNDPMLQEIYDNMMAADDQYTKIASTVDLYVDVNPSTTENNSSNTAVTTTEGKSSNTAVTVTDNDATGSVGLFGLNIAVNPGSTVDDALAAVRRDPMLRVAEMGVLMALDPENKSNPLPSDQLKEDVIILDKVRRDLQITRTQQENNLAILRIKEAKALEEAVKATKERGKVTPEEQEKWLFDGGAKDQEVYVWQDAKKNVEKEERALNDTNQKLEEITIDAYAELIDKITRANIQNGKQVSNNMKALKMEQIKEFYLATVLGLKQKEIVDTEPSYMKTNIDGTLGQKVVLTIKYNNGYLKKIQQLLLFQRISVEAYKNILEYSTAPTITDEEIMSLLQYAGITETNKENAKKILQAKLKAARTEIYKLDMARRSINVLISHFDKLEGVGKGDYDLRSSEGGGVADMTEAMVTEQEILEEVSKIKDVDDLDAEFLKKLNSKYNSSWLSLSSDKIGGIMTQVGNIVGDTLGLVGEGTQKIMYLINMVYEHGLYLALGAVSVYAYIQTKDSVAAVGRIAKALIQVAIFDNTGNSVSMKDKIMRFGGRTIVAGGIVYLTSNLWSNIDTTLGVVPKLLQYWVNTDVDELMFYSKISYEFGKFLSSQGIMGNINMKTNSIKQKILYDFFASDNYKQIAENPPPSITYDSSHYNALTKDDTGNNQSIIKTFIDQTNKGDLIIQMRLLVNGYLVFAVVSLIDRQLEKSGVWPYTSASNNVESIVITPAPAPASGATDTTNQKTTDEPHVSNVGDRISSDSISSDGISSDSISSDGRSSAGISSDGISSDGISSDGRSSDGRSSDSISSGGSCKFKAIPKNESTTESFVNKKSDERITFVKDYFQYEDNSNCVMDARNKLLSYLKALYKKNKENGDNSIDEILELKDIWEEGLPDVEYLTDKQREEYPIAMNVIMGTQARTTTVLSPEQIEENKKKQDEQEEKMKNELIDICNEVKVDVVLPAETDDTKKDIRKIATHVKNNNPPYNIFTEKNLEVTKDKIKYYHVETTSDGECMYSSFIFSMFYKGIGNWYNKGWVPAMPEETPVGGKINYMGNLRSVLANYICVNLDELLKSGTVTIRQLLEAMKRIQGRGWGQDTEIILLAKMFDICVGVFKQVGGKTQPNTFELYNSEGINIQNDSGTEDNRPEQIKKNCVSNNKENIIYMLEIRKSGIESGGHFQALIGAPAPGAATATAPAPATNTAAPAPAPAPATAATAAKQPIEKYMSVKSNQDASKTSINYDGIMNKLLGETNRDGDQKDKNRLGIIKDLQELEKEFGTSIRKDKRLIEYIVKDKKNYTKKMALTDIQSLLQNLRDKENNTAVKEATKMQTGGLLKKNGSKKKKVEKKKGRKTKRKTYTKKKKGNSKKHKKKTKVKRTTRKR